MAYLMSIGGPKAVCDRCGFEYNLSRLRKEWTGFMVCDGAGSNHCWEPRHPQEYVRAVPDRQGVRPNMRPEPADVFIYSFLIREDGTTYVRETTPYPIVRE